MQTHQLIIDNLVTAVVLLDADLRVVLINSAAEDLLHTSASHATGLRLQELIVRGDQLFDLLRQALQSEQPFTDRGTHLRLPDSVTMEIDLTVSIITSPQPRLLLEMQTLNRLRRINKDGECIVRQETTRQLIRGLAHQVKNPLGGIRGAAQLLERELASDDLREYTGVIISEVDRLKTLVDSMLGPQRQLNIGPVNILRVLEHVIRLIDAESPGRITWERDYDPSLPRLAADQAQIIQAVMNIARNAREATDGMDDARIKLRSRVIRQFTIGSVRHRLVMQLDIIDNGPGIQPDLEERIFFPMISGRADGTGLGLAITQNIIAQHHGSVQVESRPGYTCFTIYLPFPVEGQRGNSRCE